MNSIAAIDGIIYAITWFRAIWSARGCWPLLFLIRAAAAIPQHGYEAILHDVFLDQRQKSRHWAQITESLWTFADYHRLIRDARLQSVYRFISRSVMNKTVLGVLREYRSSIAQSLKIGAEHNEPFHGISHASGKPRLKNTRSAFCTALRFLQLGNFLGIESENGGRSRNAIITQIAARGCALFLALRQSAQLARR